MIHDAPQLAGLGDGYSTGAEAANISGSVASGALTTAASAGTIAASTAAIALPIIGAAVLAVTIVLGVISRRNAQKKAATSIVNDVEPQLRANVDGYLSGPRTTTSRLQALQNFDTGWNLVLQNCGQESLGSAGQRCISERQEGASPQWDACKPSCPNWFTLYRYPIERDTPKADADPLTAAGQTISGAFADVFHLDSATASKIPEYLAYAALALGVAML